MVITIKDPVSHRERGFVFWCHWESTHGRRRSTKILQNSRSHAGHALGRYQTFLSRFNEGVAPGQVCRRQAPSKNRGGKNQRTDIRL